ncbi:WEB family protein At2g40480 isoform X2 [Punica granatum]|uniref:WEB family protein At2g40480 isoform X2 n=1 Tax=Punica granatum TaxID=22663 RepID=A0A6P8CLP5_PUNGR|nr:WEB family protein At2g40480 isoform X2 [Punica granatum]
MADTPDSGSGTGSNPFCHSPKFNHGPKTPNLRAEIDTSPPFGSVKEAVTHFESSGAWIHLHKLGLGHHYNIGDIDIKKVEEQTLELEKDLIVKELETLDVLEELGTTKRIVEDLKWQLQKEALKCMAVTNPNERMATPDIGEVNKENRVYLLNGAQDKLAVGSSSPCPMSSPDLILMELNQAKLNLGKTINELGSIQTSVESLNVKIKKEKALLEKTRERMALKSSTVPELKVQQRNHSPYADSEDRILERSADDAKEVREMNFRSEQFEEEMPVVQQANTNVMRTAEMRLAAAKKMEEAAKAAEAVAIAEIKALSGNNEDMLSFLLPEPNISIISKAISPLNSKVPKMQKKNTREALFQIDDGVSVSRVSILKKLDDAADELKLSKQALEEALQRLEIANHKQLAAGEALRKWAPETRTRGGTTTTRLTHSTPSDHPLSSPLVNLPKPTVENESEPKPVLRSTVSMRDVLSRKQVVLPEDYMPRRQNEGRKVALSQMLNELREDITLPSRSEGNNQQKQYMTQRKKFGFIHISLPLSKPSRKNAHNSDLR